MAARASVSPWDAARARSFTTRRVPIASWDRRKRAWEAGSTKPRRHGYGPSARSLSANSLHAMRLERGDERLGVLAIARLDEELDLGALHRGRAEDALVLHF